MVEDWVGLLSRGRRSAPIFYPKAFPPPVITLFPIPWSKPN